MNRDDLEKHVQNCIDAGCYQVFLLMDGDPNARTQRLLGPHNGPYGRVVGTVPPCNVVMFNAMDVRAYLDQLPTHEFGAMTDVACEIASSLTHV